eukprot:GHRR01035683.1.p1 GENE.GHRR01035683.1~~GHRR01035683.1.p1  ORF type:complete len:106 (-),score=7.02 GHRR01035683.1:6-323(-)
MTALGHNASGLPSDNGTIITTKYGTLLGQMPPPTSQHYALLKTKSPANRSMDADTVTIIQITPVCSKPTTLPTHRSWLSPSFVGRLPLANVAPASALTVRCMAWL